MENYCSIVKNKLNMLIHSMEKNVSEFVVNPKRDLFVKVSCLFQKQCASFSEWEVRRSAKN